MCARTTLRPTGANSTTAPDESSATITSATSYSNYKTKKTSSNGAINLTLVMTCSRAVTSMVTMLHHESRPKEKDSLPQQFVPPQLFIPSQRRKQPQLVPHTTPSSATTHMPSNTFRKEQSKRHTPTPAISGLLSALGNTAYTTFHIATTSCPYESLKQEPQPGLVIPKRKLTSTTKILTLKRTRGKSPT